MGRTKNGELMTLCVAHGFDVLITIDKNLIYQQNMDRYRFQLQFLIQATVK